MNGRTRADVFARRPPETKKPTEDKLEKLLRLLRAMAENVGTQIGRKSHRSSRVSRTCGDPCIRRAWPSPPGTSRPAMLAVATVAQRRRAGWS